jgi:ectoine hydroxylase-related dioxygenase (phytanoyl-CoA dioxygenase family)
MNTKMMLKMGKRELEFPGKYLGELREANELLSDVEALRARMEEDGYLLIRGLFEREKVLAARRQMVEVLLREGALDPSFPPMEAVVAPGQSGSFRGGDNDLTRSPAFGELIQSAPVMNFFERFLDGEPMTYDYRWLRIVGPGSNTGAHYDVVYMGRGTHNLYTCWTPLGDVPLELGPLALLVGSHRFERIKETYGKMDVDRDHITGWFSNDPVELVDTFGGQWRTSEFRAGDVLIFGMFTMHASLNNTSNRFRISSDTRYQLRSEPVDERWIGRKPKGHYAWTKGQTVTMEEARTKWRV